ncbi:L,D-transpeptidase family protein [Pararhodobacter zhoushanensis]|uniref:L,D-transpeptidase family protein n=1 Tax=Pararhodobacter zhoushanensis TaxID=2479545 RepID=A0ABT3GW14_9RHOB|nr:L,D-transpeptidase family protein [Pararhodobacter zhoushanensis]MCW1931724.1 L,D-transpeptidase family protein [Pararhodobacter zhoushanensis]
MHRRFVLQTLAAVAVIGGADSASAQSRGHTPPPMAAPHEQADFVLVLKAARRLTLYRQGQPIREYRISMGDGANDGPKRFEGDGRTPEGRYIIDWRNPNSLAYLSLHISYPNEADVAYAESQGRRAGGDIMIHGINNGWGFLGVLQRSRDWTAGCIAVTNREMRQIWSLVPDGTPIELRP